MILNKRLFCILSAPRLEMTAVINTMFKMTVKILMIEVIVYEQKVRHMRQSPSAVEYNS